MKTNDKDDVTALLPLTLPQTPNLNPIPTARNLQSNERGVLLCHGPFIHQPVQL